MEKLEHIVVGTDFSRPASHAVRRAEQLALQHSATLEIVHAVSLGAKQAVARLLGVSAPAPNTYEKARAQLASKVEVARARGFDTQGRLYEGDPPAALGAAVGRSRADLLVVGRRAKLPRRDLFGGTFAKKVIDNGCQRALFVDAVPLTPYRRVLACVPLRVSAGGIIKAAMAMAKPSEVDVLHVFKPRFEGKLLASCAPSWSDGARQKYEATAVYVGCERLEVLLETLDISIVRDHAMVRRGDPAEAILSTLEQQDYDLVVLGAPASDGSTGFGRSIALEVVDDAPCAPCDVMVVRT